MNEYEVRVTRLALEQMKEIAVRMHIAELLVEVCNDNPDHRTDKNLIEHDPEAQSQKNRHTFVAGPHQEVWRHISSGRYACFLHFEKTENV